MSSPDAAAAAAAAAPSLASAAASAAAASSSSTASPEVVKRTSQEYLPREEDVVRKTEKITRKIQEVISSNRNEVQVHTTHCHCRRLKLSLT